VCVELLQSISIKQLLEELIASCDLFMLWQLSSPPHLMLLGARS